MSAPHASSAFKNWMPPEIVPLYNLPALSTITFRCIDCSSEFTHSAGALAYEGRFGNLTADDLEMAICCQRRACGGPVTATVDVPLTRD
jgi:hypothetical protein